jgi:arginase family enzyme
MGEAVILNFDDSIGSLPGHRSIALQDWQERIRYGCSLRDLTALEDALNRENFGFPDVAFLGSGDFHHVSFLLIRRMASKRPFQVVVFDNHPDNMRYPWGIHCGSWIHHLCRLPFVSRVTVIGIASKDIQWNHLLENYLVPLYTGKLRYLCLSPISRLAHLLGLSSIRDFRYDADALPQRIAAYLREEDTNPIYLSIDKDVLSSRAVQTNWDQGTLTARALIRSIERLKPYVIAADVTGEISFHAYRKRWKKLLSKLDGQSAVPPRNLNQIRSRHHQINQKILRALSSR